MRDLLGKLQSSISNLVLSKRYLYNNTLILGEEGSGKTHLASKIRYYVMDNNVPTLYLDFSDPEVSEVEARYREDENFNYLRFEESEAFDKALNELIAQRKHIYLAVNPKFFTYKRGQKSEISKMLQKQELLDNYYYFFHEIAQLKGFYTEFEDFFFYIFDLINMKKFGLTFLTQPNEIFEDNKIKLLFSSLFVGKCSNADYYNTSVLRNLPRNHFYYQYRTEHHSILMNPIKSDIAIINT